MGFVSTVSALSLRTGSALLALAVLCGVSASDLRADTVAIGAGPDEAVGTQFHVRLEDLPEPGERQVVSNRPVVVDRPSGARLRVPAGFRATLFADGLTHPRAMAVAADGAVFVTEPNAGHIMRLQDTDGDGTVDERSIFAAGFHLPSGLALQEGALYVADERAVWWLGLAEGRARAEARRPVTRPGALGDAGGHWTRMLRFSPDGRSFYVSVGSERNLAEEELPRASVQRFDLVDGTRMTFASGLRNPVGLAFHPETGGLFTVVNERDGLGDDLVPDYLTDIEQGDFFGWPYAYLGTRPDPEFGDIRPDLVAQSKTPPVLFAAHSGALDLLFYDGASFPADYRGDAFVAFHGSWNAARPTGYKIVRVPFEGGRPTGTYETFAIGFWLEGSSPARVWGRPAGLTLDRQGALFISDDEGGTIWRVSWSGS